MVPINLQKIERHVNENPDARRLYLLCEGTFTEPSFLKAVLSNSNYLSNPEISFYEVCKTGKEHGVTDIDGLIRLAYQIIDNKTIFDKKHDKVILAFDLDVYKNQLLKIKQVIEGHKKYIIFAFSNPAIELFLLLCKEHSYEKIIESHKDDILKNEWVNKEDGTRYRYIHNLLIESTSIDPKTSGADFGYFSSRIEIEINQEKCFMSSILVDLSKNLICNVGRILEELQKGNFDDIKYQIL